MADFDGNIKLGVSLNIDKKSLVSELNSISSEIKKTFNGLGKEITISPSSFSNITKSVSTVSKSANKLQSDLESAYKSYKYFVDDSASRVRGAFKVEELDGYINKLQECLAESSKFDNFSDSLAIKTYAQETLDSAIEKRKILIDLEKEEKNLSESNSFMSKIPTADLDIEITKLEESTEPIKEQTEEIKQEQIEVDKLKELYQDLYETLSAIRNFEKGQQRDMSSHDYIEAQEHVKSLKDQIAQERIRNQIDFKNEELVDAKNSKSNLKLFDFKGRAEANDEISEIKEEIKELEDALKELQGIEVDPLENFDKSNSRLINLRSRIQDLIDTKKEYEESGAGTGYKEYDKVIKELQKLNVEYEKAEKRHFSAFGDNVVTRFIDKIKSLKSHLSKLGIHTKKFGNTSHKSFGKTLLILGKALIGVRSLYMLFRKVRQYIGQAFNTLAVQFPEINRQMSELKTSLQGLKASLGTALQPLFSAIQPLLNSIIQKLTTAIELVGKFFASLTGQGYIYKAKTAWQDYAKSISGANKELGKLGAYDKLNVIGPDDNGGNGSTLDGVKYEKEDLEDIFDLDAYGWGQLFGTKLQEALMSIPWNEIKEKARTVGTYIAEFLNGFLETEIDGIGLGYTIGDTLAQAINTGFEFLYSAFSTFHWDSLGKFIADGINGLFNIDLSLVFATISEWKNGILQAIVSFIEGIDWAGLGHFLVEGIVGFITGIDWGGIASKIMEGLGALLGGLALTMFTMMQDLGTFIVEGLEGGIGNAISSIGTWIKENIFDPFINGFKKIFGIASPSTVMMEMGEFLIEGLKQGIGNIWEKISGAFNTVKENVRAIWDNIKSGASSAWESIKSKISGVVTSIKSTVVSIFNSMKTAVGSVFDAIWSKIKGVINSIIGGVERMANGIISGLNGMISALNGLHFDVPSWVPFIGGNSLGFNIPSLSSISIPRLAQGAVIPPNKQFLAMLGDQASGTNIEAPLDTIKQALVEALQESGRGGEPIVLQLNSKVIAKAVWDENEKRYKQTGTSYAY